jgi:hypothetical protein
VVTAGVVLAAAACICHAAALYRVAGVVVNAQTGAPVAHVKVFVMRDGGEAKIASLTTGGDGKFAFDLPEGKHELFAGEDGVLQSLGARRPDLSIGTAVVTGPDQDTAHLIFRWFPLGSISGRVADQDGEPVENALVQLLALRNAAGRASVVPMGWDYTNDLGEYRFGPVPGGSYFLAVTGEPWYTRDSEDDLPAGLRVMAYPAVYYPNVRDAARAGVLLVKPGEHVRADFALSAAPGSTVTVTVNEAAARKQPCQFRLVTEGIRGSEGSRQYDFLFGGQNAIHGVAVGHYIAQAECRTVPPAEASQSIEVHAGENTVELTPAPLAVVSGTVQFKDPGEAPQSDLRAVLVREDLLGSAAATVKPDGSYSFPSVATGRYRPILMGRDGYFAETIRVDGANFHDGVVDLAPGLNVTIGMLASGETGLVKGFVVRDEHPVEGALVVLAPAAGSNNPLLYGGFQTDSDGSFEFKHTRAGEYYLFAVEDPGLEYMNPPMVRPYFARAKKIRVDAHGTYSEQIPLLAGN